MQGEKVREYKKRGPKPFIVGQPRTKIQPFIKRLVKMLADPKCANTITWEEADGYGVLTILQPENLQQELLPKYFKHSKLTSLIRQLNMHGFRKLHKRRHKEGQKMIFASKHFIPNQLDLYKNIRRLGDQAGPVERDSSRLYRLQEQVKDLELKVALLESDKIFKILEFLRSGPLFTYSPQLNYVLKILGNSFSGSNQDNFRQRLTCKDVDRYNLIRDLLSSLNYKFIHEKKWQVQQRNWQAGRKESSQLQPDSDFDQICRENSWTSMDFYHKLKNLSSFLDSPSKDSEEATTIASGSNTDLLDF